VFTNISIGQIKITMTDTIMCENGKLDLITNSSSPKQLLDWYIGDWKISDKNYLPSYRLSNLGDYVLKVCENGICDSVTISVLESPKLSVYSYSACYDDTVTIGEDFGEGATYLWDDGSTTATINVSKNKGQVFKVYLPNGCSGESFLRVDNPNSYNYIEQIDPAKKYVDKIYVCAGESVDLKANANINSTYEWNDVIGTNELLGTTAGKYLLKVTDADGCAAVDSVEIIEVTYEDTLAFKSEVEDTIIEFCEDSLSTKSYVGIWEETTYNGGRREYYVTESNTFVIGAKLTSGCIFVTDTVQYIKKDCDSLITKLVNPNTTEVSIYPNPASSIINIQSDRQIIKLQLFDLSGKKVLEKSVNNMNEELRVEHLRKGIYFLEITGEKESHTQKIIRK
jgi:hypothetical protein